MELKPVACGAHHKSLTNDQELDIAESAIGEADLPHAAHHLANAVMNDPADARMIELLGRALNAAEDAVELFPLKDDNYVGTVACRVFALGANGRYAEAFDLLPHLHKAAPHREFLKWGTRWLGRAGAAEQVDPVKAASCFAGYLQMYPGIVVESAEGRADLSELEPVALRMAQLHPTDGVLAGFYAAVIRKLGRIDEAIKHSEAAFRANRSYMTGCALAMALSGAGRSDEAIEVYKEMIKIDPKDAAARADIAEIHLSERRFEEALKWAEDTLRVDPAHTTAMPMSYFLKALLGRQGDWQGALERYAEQNPSSDRARYWLNSLKPFVGFLPHTTEASLDGIRQFLDSRKPGEEPVAPGAIKMTISSMEAPSAWQAIELALGWPRGSFTPEITEIPHPDPRVPRGEVDYLLWRYDGTAPRPALPAPHAYVVKKVLEIAERPYDAESWWAMAGSIAAELGPKSVPSLLGMMVNPAAPPTGWPAWDWVQRQQFASAFIIARVDAGWSQSHRRKALYSLLRGPVDWTTNAGYTAMVQLAIEERSDEIAAEATDMLMELAKNRPNPGYCCYEYAMVINALRLPNLDASLRYELQKWRAGLEQSE
ncbi:tetratricopeptide repeat protein [Humisphaera borealis]|uniref:Tetratricopeptide repeat protein n=1 Tax=Humisphaera borealis TaxID=2807512 RepID=A0A7M2X0G8_9BACT|nr:tetratricopeptide repeat protein [Humisphaera borealis]QOV91185.1 tetratricopeptide repeat protein [Humisphaera borealis]